MKKFSIGRTLQFVVLVSCCSLLFSCRKDNAIVDAAYPDQAIYLTQSSAAVSLGGGVYTIIPNVYNQAQRFVVDVAGNNLNIPLGIYRSGINKSGGYTISIATNTDTITKLIAAGRFVVATDPLVTTELLPASAYAIPGSAELPDGGDNATFIINVNLPYLINSFTTTPKKRYAVAVTITNSKSSIVKTALSTVVILVDPAQVIPPISNFTSYIYSTTKTANFFNVAANGVSYSWSFGDNTNVSTDPAPSHVYAASGTYTVTLTTTGIAGSGTPSVKTASVVIP